MWRTASIIGPTIGAALVLAAVATADAQTGVQPGERVVVTSPQARLMRGQQTVAMASRGQELVVLKVDGSWIGTQLDVNGKSVGGWIWSRAIAPLSGSVSQRAIQRRFSFEPDERFVAPPRMERSSPRSGSTRTPSYFLPKTDPNRFR